MALESWPWREQGPEPELEPAVGEQGPEPLPRGLVPQEPERLEQGPPPASTGLCLLRGPASCCIHPEAVSLPKTMCSAKHQRPACVQAPAWCELRLKKRA